MKTLLKNAKVWLGNNKFAEAVGMDSETGMITFAGYNKETDNFLKEYDEVIDLEKRLVIPAFCDGHCHFVQGSLIKSQLDLRNAGSKNDFKKAITQYKRRHKGKWIYGGFFSETNFKEKFIPDRNFLDSVCPDVPVIISRFDIHSAFANSKALEISNIENKRDLFTNEEIVMQNGNLTGELKERAMDFVMDCIPEVSVSEKTIIAFEQMKLLNSYGITSISDITFPEDLDVYKTMYESGQLNLKVDSRLPFTEFDNLNKYKSEFSKLNDRIIFNSLKAFYDGSLTSRTALMHDNYKNESHNGIKTEYVNSGEFHKTAYEIDRAGYQMSVHAIGDKAVTELLDLNVELIKKNGKKDRRFRIEHAQHIAERDFGRFSKLNVIASVQPGHLFSDAKTSFDVLTDYSSSHNYKKLIETRAVVCFGTDFPVIGENPFETIYYAVTRKAGSFGEGFLTDNCFTVEESLAAYTSGNAYAMFEEKTRGKISPGYVADVAVINQDLFSIPNDEIKDASVHMTFFGGKRIY